MCHQYILQWSPRPKIEEVFNIIGLKLDNFLKKLIGNFNILLKEDSAVGKFIKKKQFFGAIKTPWCEMTKMPLVESFE